MPPIKNAGMQVRLKTNAVTKRQQYAAKADVTAPGSHTKTAPLHGVPEAREQVNLRDAGHACAMSEVYEIEVQDLSDDNMEELRKGKSAPAVLSVDLATFDLQETLIRELTDARRTMTLQQEQALARVERTCVDSVTRMEAALTKLRFDKARLEEQLRLAEEVRRAQSGSILFQAPRPGVPLPLPGVEAVAEPPLTAPGAPKMELALQHFQSEDGHENSMAPPVKLLNYSHTRTMEFAATTGPDRDHTRLSRAREAQAKAGRGKNVFVDASSMKEKVKEAVMKPEYNVMDFYKDEGRWQSIARSSIFENTTLVVVFINAIWIWIDTDFNSSETLNKAHPVFIIVENFFCAYFTAELLVRFMSFRKKRYCLQDAWFNFDSVLVLLMVVETWVFTFVIGVMPGMENITSGSSAHQLVRLVRLMRLTRMARMVRLLRAIPELMVLFKSVMVAIRSVVFTLCLLVVFIYVFALIFVQLDQSSALGEAFQDNLRTVPDAMAFLLLRGILPDLADHVYMFGQATVLGSVIFLLFILVASLTIMNMLMGVLVQVIGAVSDVERERMTVQWVKVKLLEMMETSGIGSGESGLDLDGDMQISKGEFQQLLLNPKAAKMVQEVGVDVVGLVDFADFIFEDDRELSFAQFMELVLQLRGSNIATVKDIVDLRKFISAELQASLKKECERWTTSMITASKAKEFLPEFGARKDNLQPEHEV